MITSTRLVPIDEVVAVSAGELHRADPKLKQTALLGVGATVLIGGAALWMLDRWLAQSVRVDHAFDVVIMAYIGLGVLITGGLLVLAWSLWQEARLVRREGRYPAANMRTLRDVPIVDGEQAHRAARHLVWTAIGLAIGSCLLVWELYSTLDLVVR